MTNIRLICHRPGFRRCGIGHVANKVWPDGYWTDAQLEIFDKDPQFEVLTGGDVEIEPKIDEGSNEPEIGALDADDPIRMAAIDEVIGNLEASGFGTEGQPGIQVLKKQLGFVPMPEEVMAAAKRHDPDGKPGEWGLAMRASAIVEAVKKFSPSDFTKEGVPKIPALQKAVGFKPTPDEMNSITPK